MADPQSAVETVQTVEAVQALKYLLTFSCIAALVSYPLTNFVALTARRLGFVDRPDGHHKGHDREVALGGGLAVFLAAFITFAVEYISSEPLQQLLVKQSPYLGGLLLAGIWIVGIGLIDDRFGMSGKIKLVGQLIAALIVVAAGLQIHNFVVFGFEVHLGFWSVPFTVFWLLGAMNSLNLLDGIDGLATTIGIILCATIAVMALVIGQTAVAIVAAVFVGSLVGFLRFNFPPAKIFLGDAGSMLIGLIVGALAIGGSLKGTAAVALAAPLAIWALPMFDSFVAILRRKLVGRSIYATDRGHLHHRLMALFGKNTRVLAVVAVCCAVTCAGALMSLFMHNDLVALGAVLAVICMLIATQAFGHIELKMLLSRFKWLLMALLLRKENQEVSFQIQGTREWDMLWQSLVEFGEEMELVDIRLDINLAAVQEAYHASWRRPCKSERRARWRTEIPLFSDEHVIGRLIVSGSRKAGISSCEAIDRLIEMLEPLEAEIVAMAASCEHVKSGSNQPTSPGSSMASASPVPAVK
ncbi:MAG: undecaprenyl/decaprenyl-phosphate alpha-N-acetylglucosaminyl 1-phosphate transferase [Planctomycetales bacterium]|nr:undecaprenyl/decaprenyl-phosphate alpha-N-acetylglucosaminyl 1-phosphate transferase [Planctomycetales bacterium]